MFTRQKYLNQLLAFKDKDLIKVVTGVRRCGKSTLLNMMQEYLRCHGVSDERILSFKMESMDYDGLTYKELYNLVKEKTTDINHPYLFFDELQDIEGWEKAINSLRVDIDCDIYITGSNAYLLSSELSTLLSGRYIEIEMLPLTFAEYLDFQGAKPANQEYSALDLFTFQDGSFATTESLINQYRRFGGLPYLALEKPNIETHRAYCKTLYDTVVVRDILQRDKRRDRRQITNEDLLKRLCTFLSNNVGNENSINSIVGALKAENIKAVHDTVNVYINALCEAYLFYPIRRFDIKGKELLKTGGKHYIVDTGIRNFLEGYRDRDQGHMLENIVYLQLLYDGFDVSIGKLRNGEVDFIASNAEGKTYIQVTEDMTDPITLKRELAPLQSIRDSYPKVIIAMRGNYPTEIDGVRILGASDFLLHQKRPIV